jgi:hypothetical protein
MDRFAVSAFLGGVSYFVATLTYAFADGRFYLPVFLLLVVLAVLPAEWAVSQILELRFSVSTVAVLILFLLTCIGYPSQSGFEPMRNRLQTWDALVYPNTKGRSRLYEAQKQFSRSFAHSPGIVFSDINPVYLNVVLPKPFVAAPIDKQHNYCFSGQWHYDKADAARLAQGGLDHSIPVYALLLPSKHVDRDLQRLPAIRGYAWRRSEKSNRRVIIMTLTKEQAAPDS